MYPAVINKIILLWDGNILIGKCQNSNIWLMEFTSVVLHK